MGDIVGRLFREFAVTLAVTILVSAVVSLTLTPDDVRQAAKASRRKLSKARFYRVTEHGWKTIISFYDRTLQWVLRYQTATLLVAAGTLVLTICAFHRIFRKGFFPIQDTGVIQGVSEAAQTVSFPEMSSQQQALARIILKDPAVDSLSSFIGIDGTNTTLNSGRILINLKPLDERKISASDVIRRLQPELAQVPGITLFMQPVQDITRGRPGQPHAVPIHAGRSQRRRVGYLCAADAGQAAEVSRAARCGKRSAGRAGCAPSWCSTATRLTAWASRPSTIDQTLYDAYGQREVSTIFTQLNQYHVVLEVKPPFQQNPLDLRDLFIRTNAVTSAAMGSTGLVSGGSAATQLFGPTSSLTAATTSLSATTAASGALLLHRLGQRLRRRSDCVHFAIPQRRPGAAYGLHVISRR